MTGAGQGTGRWLAQHWLAVFLITWGAFISLPVLAPVLALHGEQRLSHLIYLAYRPACHQLPHRSWFLGGRAMAYDWETIRAELHVADPMELYHRPVGNPRLGYPMAYCQRDTATHTTLWLTGVGYGVLRRRRRVRRIPFGLFVAAAVPLAVDGLAQLVGWRESSALSRTLTGGLFGLASGLLILPELGEAADELRQMLLPNGSRTQ